MFWLTYFWIPHSVGMTQISAAPTFIMDNICRSALNTLSFDMIIKINQLLFPKLYFIVISYPWDLQTFWHRHLCMIKNVSHWNRFYELQVCVLRKTKGPFLYYLRVFEAYLNQPTTFVRTFSLDKVRENCHFLDHLPTPMTLRNLNGPLSNLFTDIMVCKSN